MFIENVQRGTQIILITFFVIRQNEREVAKQAQGELRRYGPLDMSLGKILNNKQKESKNVVTGQLFKE